MSKEGKKITGTVISSILMLVVLVGSIFLLCLNIHDLKNLPADATEGAEDVATGLAGALGGSIAFVLVVVLVVLICIVCTVCGIIGLCISIASRKSTVKGIRITHYCFIGGFSAGLIITLIKFILLLAL